jgi:hypothetical protein
VAGFFVTRHMGGFYFFLILTKVNAHLRGLGRVALWPPPTYDEYKCKQRKSRTLNECGFEYSSNPKVLSFELSLERSELLTE